ncbi:glycosyltransferase [Novosphingobium pituita]|uniref:Glycosyltransferase n=1 Tax=Novosphingobium pituita TaxID=3056842 RepID=A0ABQ6PAZ2_9SPHN|nr:glycosyltransferase [Novosphingobium sp. IK01]GMM61966.1 glycosyltransferase [Novosphingobium sp. IK01]
MGGAIAQRQGAPADWRVHDETGENACQTDGAMAPPLAAEVPILLYMPAFHGGGAENALVRLANHWHAQGRKVTIIVNAVRGPVVEKVVPGVEIVALGSRFTALAWPRLGMLLRRRRPAFLATALLGPNVAGLWAARLWSPCTAVACLVRNHTTREIAGRDRLRRALFPPLLRAAYRRADGVGCVAGDVAQDIIAYAALSPERVMTTLNPVPFPETEPFPQTGREHEPDLSGDWPPSGPVIVAMGRMVAQKDYPTLLRAFARLEGAPHLLILGEGPLRAELEALCLSLGIAGRVHMPGFRNRPEACLARADLFVLSSRFEGFPNVIAEALALGRTVVATDAPGGGAEILGSGAFGHLVPVGDVAALARAMARALADPVDPARARERARDFAIEAVSRRYEALFARAMEHRRNG